MVKNVIYTVGIIWLNNEIFREYLKIFNELISIYSDSLLYSYCITYTETSSVDTFLHESLDALVRSYF